MNKTSSNSPYLVPLRYTQMLRISDDAETLCKILFFNNKTMQEKYMGNPENIGEAYTPGRNIEKLPEMKELEEKMKVLLGKKLIDAETNYLGEITLLFEDEQKNKFSIKLLSWDTKDNLPDFKSVEISKI